MTTEVSGWAREADAADRTSLPRAVLDRVGVLLIAGGLTGLLVVGVGGPLAMLVLRLTSADSVRGVVSDDGFVIGQVTLSGTYNLFQTRPSGRWRATAFGSMRYPGWRPWHSRFGPHGFSLRSRVLAHSRSTCNRSPDGGSERGCSGWSALRRGDQPHATVEPNSLDGFVRP